jgi:FtsZ-interacting cell division protein ZipA
VPEKSCVMKRKLRDIWRATIVSMVWKNKRKVHFEVGKMDKHIFHCDEVANDDDSYDASYDDNHLETAKRVAENAFKTPSCDKKAKTATPYGQKTDEYESTRPPAGNNNTIIGNTKGKARSKVRKMDNHIVDCDVVESDDDLSDDIHVSLLMTKPFIFAHPLRYMNWECGIA